MFDVKRLLSKKSWTGEEIGKLIIFDLVEEYRQVTEGKPVKPLFTTEQLTRMRDTLSGKPHDITIYNRYIGLQNWLMQNQAVANAYLQRLQGDIANFMTVIQAAEAAENEYAYIERLPRIMTQKQYDEYRAKRIEEQLATEKGDDSIGYNVFSLVVEAFRYFYKALSKDPKKANPLKAVKKRYIREPVKDRLILDRYNVITQSGYYTLPNGVRSDRVSEEEWREALASYSPVVADALEAMTEDGETDLTLSPAAMQRALSSARAAHMGDDMPDSESPATWHYDEEAPTLSKWDFLEGVADNEYLPEDFYTAIFGEDEAAELEALKAFKEEFALLVDAMLAELDKRTGQGFSAVPVEEWPTTVITWRELYNADLFGFKAEIEADTAIFEGDRRAILNGIAIVRPSTMLNRSPRIDGSGYYIEPETGRFSTMFGLDRYTPANPECGDAIEEVEDRRHNVEESLYWILAFNTAIELVSKRIGLPCFTIFQLPYSRFVDRVEAVNSLFDMLYTHIESIDYADSKQKAAKLEALREVFYPLKAKELAIPQEIVAEAKQLVADLEAFTTQDGRLLNLLTAPRGEA